MYHKFQLSSKARKKWYDGGWTTQAVSSIISYFPWIILRKVWEGCKRLFEGIFKNTFLTEHTRAAGSVYPTFYSTFISKTNLT